MSIHSLPDVAGVDVADVIARQEYGEDTVESQDNDLAAYREEKLAVEAVYFRTMNRKRKRREWSPLR